MGKHKDEHGKTRVGKLLGSIGEVFPDLASSAIRVATSGNPLAAIGGEIKQALRNKLGSDDKDERMNAQALLDEMELILKYEAEENQQVTDRWKADMNSDSWLSKNIRPMTLIFMLLTMTALIISDSVSTAFEVKNHWIKLLSDLLWIVFLAYFGGRTIEKMRRKQ